MYRTPWFPTLSCQGICFLASSNGSNYTTDTYNSVPSLLTHHLNLYRSILFLKSVSSNTTVNMPQLPRRVIVSLTANAVCHIGLTCNCSIATILKMCKSGKKSGFCSDFHDSLFMTHIAFYVFERCMRMKTS